MLSKTIFETKPSKLLELEKLPRAFFPLFNCTIMFALTYSCQCKCRHCGSGLHAKSPERELKKEDVLRTIGRLKELGASHIYFFGGEPLLSPYLTEYVKYCSEKNINTRIDTNGLLLDEKKVQELKAADVGTISVSIDSPEKNEHDSLRGVKGTYGKAIEGIRLCRKYDIDCMVSTYATKDNLRNNKLRRIIDIAKDNGATVWITSSICTGNWSKHEEKKLNDEEIQLLKSLLEKGVVKWESLDDKNGEFSCLSLNKANIYITAYGDVQPCCFMPKCFGNVKTRDIKDIVNDMWKSKMYLKKSGYKECPVNDARFNSEYLKDCETELSSQSKHPSDEYDDWAQTYDRENHTTGVNDDIVLSRVDFVDKTVMDIGCGTARFASRIAKVAKDITLVDYSDNMLSVAKRNMGDIRNISYRKADIEKEDFEMDGKFDVITAFTMMHHLKNKKEVIEKLKSLLERDGVLVITDVLGNVGKKEVLEFNKSIIAKYGFLKWFESYLIREVIPSRLKKHLANENYDSYQDSFNAYKELLPGSRISAVNGVFVLVIWSKKEEV